MKTVAVIGGGPAGLMAAEVLAEHNVTVNVYEAKPSVGRKFLVAGKGGMNLTHAEPFETFVTRYGSAVNRIRPLLTVFGPDEVRAWCRELSVDTFVGSSGRVFPVDMKALPLLRKWLQRLRDHGVNIYTRHRWQGWNSDGSLLFDTPVGPCHNQADAVVLALGGASWPRLGSDGAWLPVVAGKGIEVAELRPSNCGFEVIWSDHFRKRHAGEPLKSVILTFTSHAGETFQRHGSCVVTENGLEGSLIYAASALLREEIAWRGAAGISLDLAPGRTVEQLRQRLSAARGSRTVSSHLKSRLKLKPVEIGLLYEFVPAFLNDPERLAHAIKAVPISLIATRPIAEAISTAGGICFDALDERLMVRSMPGLFCAGEMLDWEAPTGGYLLTACFASGRVAGQGAWEWLRKGRWAGENGNAV